MYHTYGGTQGEAERLREVTHRGGGVVYLYEGGTRLRPATREEAASLPILSVWGMDVIRVAAERHFVSK